MADKKNEMDELASRDWDVLEGLASQLEDAWKKGGPVDLAPLLPEVGSPLRKHALIELIKVDLECRWRRFQPVVLDYYTDKFPELGRARDLPAKLIVEEYRVRHLFGDKPGLPLYQTRFPNQYDEFCKLIADEPLPTQEHVATKPEGKVTGAKPESPPMTGLETVAPQRPPGYRDNILQVGEYRMIERLGAGAFGEVWRAELPGGIFKAVKVIFRPIDHEEAKRELEALNLIKGLRHHFLLQTISFRPTDDRLYILMDLADCSLRDQLKKAKAEGKQGLPLADLARWLHQAAEALDYLQEKGVQHRDIKPENILLSEGNVRVADFGLARHQATRRLVSGSGAGTPLYMPPEAWNDKVHANSDQYSLAATYAECRLGRRIYDSSGLASLMQAHVHDTPNLDPLPADEKKVLLKALAKNPDHRYPSCSAFAEDLIRTVAKTLPAGSLSGIITTSDGEPSRADLARSKRQTIALVGVLFVTVVVGVILASIFVPGPNGPNDKDAITLPTAGPAGPFRPAADAEIVTIGDTQMYKTIECALAAQPDLVVRFHLIEWPERGKQPFYMMQDMVSNDIYEYFSRDNPGAVNGSRWRLGARARNELTAPIFPTVALLAGPPWNINWAAVRVLTDDRPNAVFFQEDWPQPDDLGATRLRWPVLRVDIQEAQRCAEWFGGVLPSAEQWDKAAGRFEADRGLGPFLSPFETGEIAVGRDTLGPMPIGSAIKDISPFSGCRDMAGNGLEWTRTIIFDQQTSEFYGDVRKVSPLAKTPLRSRSFKNAEPLTFTDLEDRVLDLEFFENIRTPGYDSQIGFRIVLIP